jgi:hypothetical protein
MGKPPFNFRGSAALFSNSDIPLLSTLLSPIQTTFLSEEQYTLFVRVLQYNMLYFLVFYAGLYMDGTFPETITVLIYQAVHIVHYFLIFVRFFAISIKNPAGNRFFRKTWIQDIVPVADCRRAP